MRVFRLKPFYGYVWSSLSSPPHLPPSVFMPMCHWVRLEINVGFAGREWPFWGWYVLCRFYFFNTLIFSFLRAWGRIGSVWTPPFGGESGLSWCHPYTMRVVRRRLSTPVKGPHPLSDLVVRLGRFHIRYMSSRSNWSDGMTESDRGSEPLLVELSV